VELLAENEKKWRDNGPRRLEVRYYRERMGQRRSRDEIIHRENMPE
jgi:hypothetical protein